ncbi:hypothetical protein BH11MYX4_BH11MYX4_57090 [soil metagenome]
MFVARSFSVPVVFVSFVSVATLACSGGGSSSGLGGDAGEGGVGQGTGATATPQSGCAALSQWATGCGFTVDAKACEAAAAGHTAAQLQAATECTKTKSCDQNVVDQCVDKALASGPVGTTPDAGAATGTCDTCARASCASEVAACETLPACVSLFDCVQAAGSDKVKVQACVDQDPTGLATLQALAKCETAKCPTQCQ